MVYCNCISTLNTVGGDDVIKLDYKSAKPLHEQITQEIKKLIMCHAMERDEQLPSVRDLSVSLTVNPNTVQRAYKSLEAEGFIYSIKGKGNFVSEISHASGETIEKLYDKLSAYTRELLSYGESTEKILEAVKRALEEGTK